jgi:hypothetical protein
MGTYQIEVTVRKSVKVEADDIDQARELAIAEAQSGDTIDCETISADVDHVTIEEDDDWDDPDDDEEFLDDDEDEFDDDHDWDGGLS